MKKLVLIIILVVSWQKGFSDTINFYHVFVNDSIVAKFNEESTNTTVNLSKIKLKENDTLTVKHFLDAPRFLLFGISITAEGIKEKKLEATTKKNFGKMSIPFKDILFLQKEYNQNHFHVNFFQKLFAENLFAEDLIKEENEIQTPKESYLFKLVIK